MIIREISISNFRQITGEYTLKLALPGDKPITILLGENGAGKSTFLQACLWCLYGRKNFENPEDIVSYRALESATVDGYVKTEVRMIIQDGEETLTIERRFRGRKVAGGKLEPGTTEELKVFLRSKEGETTTIQDAKTRIEQLLPNDLAGFFFFRGEDLEQLVARAGADKLRTAVEQFVDLTLLERSIRHLSKTERELEQKLKATSTGEAQELTTKLEEIKARIQKRQDLVADQNKAEGQLNEQKESIEEELAKVENVRPYIEERRRLEQEKSHIESKIREKRKQLAKRVSKDGYLYLRSNVLKAGAELAEQARKKGELPARIKPQFVDDLLSKGECCCGTPINNDMAEKLERWKTGIKLAALESSVSVLKADLANYQGRAEEFQKEFNAARIELAELNDDLRDVAGKYSATVRELEGKDFEADYVSGLQKQLISLNDDLIKAGILKGTYSNEIVDLNQEYTELAKKRNRAVKAQDKGARLTRQIAAVNNVRKGLEKLKAGWINIVQEFLDSELKSKWKEMAQLDRLVEFDAEFRLNIKERGGDGQWHKSAPSSANKRALALAFVASLIKLADEARKGERSKGLFAGGLYPLMMDAPFATMDRYFKQTVPAGLRKVVPQLILASSYDQWTGEVETALGDAVGASYVLELHKPGESNRTVFFRGTDVDYVVGENDTAFDWTEIQKV